MEDLYPLDVLLSVMRKKWRDEDYDGAVALAKIAAPYLHGKVPATRPVGDLSGVSDDELDRLERSFGAGAPGQAPGKPE